MQQLGQAWTSLLPVSASQMKATSAQITQPENEETEEGQINSALQMFSITKATEFPKERHKWNTNEEVAAVLLAVENHAKWECTEVQVRPPSGSMLLYNRNKVRYRKDGYVWKKRKDGKTTREDHMKLKVQGVECIYGCYVHSAVLPTFHRRCYWLLQDQDMVLVHYLNVPLVEDSNKPSMMPPLLSGLSTAEERDWGEEDLLAQLRPMFVGVKQSEGSNLSEQLTEEMLKEVVKKLVNARQSKASRSISNSSSSSSHCSNKHISPRNSGGAAPQRMMSLLQPSKLAPHTGITMAGASSTNLLINSTPVSAGVRTNASSQPLILNLSQLQGSNGLIILSSQTGTPISIINNHTAGSGLIQPQPTHTVTSSTDSVLQSMDNKDAGINIAGQSDTGVNDINKSIPTAANLDHRQTITLNSSNTLDVKPSLVEDHLDMETSSSPSLSHSFTTHTHSITSLAESLPMDKTSMPAFLPDTIHPMHTNIPVTSVNTTLNAMDLTSTSNSGHSDSFPLSTLPPSNVDPSTINDLYLEDSFDILNIPDFDCPADLAINSSSLSRSETSSVGVKADQGSVLPPGCVSCGRNEKPESRMGIANITDFSPDWAFSEGGTKILVIGPWYSTTSPYTILFDDVPVPSTLVQSGVLRCFCPGHSPGLVTMQVACEGYVISNSCAFEYKLRQVSVKDQLTEWFSIPEEQLKLSLLGKLEKMEKRLATAGHMTGANQPPSQMKCDHIGSMTPAFESRMVEYCQSLSKLSWVSTDLIAPSDRAKHTLLHLVAALGYTKLLPVLTEWKTHNSSAVMEQEMNPLVTDEAMCTPLMWACARGNFELAIMLYQQDNSSLGVCNKHGLLPVSVGRLMGNLNVAEVLEKLDLARKEMIAAVGDKNSGVGGNSDVGVASGRGMEGVVSQSQPVKVTLVQTSTGMLLTPVTEPNSAGMNETQCLERTVSSPHPIPLFIHPANTITTTTLSAPLVSASTPHSTSHVGYTQDITDLTVDIPSPPQFTASVAQQPELQPPAWSSDFLCGMPSCDSGTARRLRLMKRTSVEVLPDYPITQPTGDLPPNSTFKCSKTDTDMTRPPIFKRPSERSQTEPPDLPSMTSPSSLRPSCSDPHLGTTSGASLQPTLGDPMISMSVRDLNSPVMFGHFDMSLLLDSSSLDELHHTSMAMETDSPDRQSPVVDIDDISPVDVYADESSMDEVSHYQMVTLANQIIAAMPERIKASPGLCDELFSFEFLSRRDRSSSYGSFSSACSTAAATPPTNSAPQEDSGISTPLDGMSFDEYRGDCSYGDLGTPTSSLSPASSCLHSPYSFNFDSPPPTTADFTEYFNAPAFYMEKDFSKLTLSDEEQRRLYHAAQIIQNFYRRYKDKKEQKQRQMEAAILIQSYYRRYKQYLYYKKMTQAAVLIQSQFRTYYAQKRFRKSREAATIIQNRYRAYKEQERFKKSHSAAVIIQQRFRSHYQRKRGEQGVASKVQEMMDGTTASLWTLMPSLRYGIKRFSGGGSRRNNHFF